MKGSAGIFGLDAVVAFTHHVETLLDHLREGGLALTPDLSTLLLRCNDQLGQLELGQDHPLRGDGPRKQARGVELGRHGVGDVGGDAVALVCTEIPLLVTPEASVLPTLDSTRLLARAAFDVAIGRRALPTWRGGPP